jgi:hypothetical protein
VRQALIEVAERWTRQPIADAAVRRELEDAIQHLLRRGEISGQFPAGVDAAALAHRFVAGLEAGEGPAAVARVFPPPEG